MTDNEPQTSTDISQPIDKVEVLVSVIAKLLDVRDFLGWQLDNAHGNVSDRFFNEISEFLLKEPVTLDPDRLKEKVKVLLRAVPHTLDSETISTVFGCPLDQAEQALASINAEET